MTFNALFYKFIREAMSILQRINELEFKCIKNCYHRGSPQRRGKEITKSCSTVQNEESSVSQLK